VDPADLVLAERAKVLLQVADLAAEFEDIVASVAAESPDDEHDPSGSTTGYERQRVAALLDHAYRLLAELDVALDRVSAGTFGICAECDEPIAPERLEARPTATTCIDCAPR
jgi:RNA polymerase-binding protein DksA